MLSFSANVSNTSVREQTCFRKQASETWQKPFSETVFLMEGPDDSILYSKIFLQKTIKKSIILAARILVILQFFNSTFHELSSSTIELPYYVDQCLQWYRIVTLLHFAIFSLVQVSQN